MLPSPTCPPSPASPPEAPPSRLPVVYFDGACPLCRREIAAYRAMTGGDGLDWVDASGCAPEKLGADLTREQALARLHVRDAEGRLVSGAAGFVAIWQRLPAFRAVAALARVPGALIVLEAGYRLFLGVRRAWRPAGRVTGWPAALRRELRTDHAGEAGAVMIYRGILAVARDPRVRAFARAHLDTEARHLALIEAVAPAVPRSRLLPLWRVAGWLTGALPALAGPRAVYATIAAVETFVDTHYAAQLAFIDGCEASPALAELRAMLDACRRDELHHRDDAREHLGGTPSAWLRPWLWMVAAGSSGAVRVSRWC